MLTMFVQKGTRLTVIMSANRGTLRSHNAYMRSAEKTGRAYRFSGWCEVRGFKCVRPKIIVNTRLAVWNRRTVTLQL